jgi:hypothetical protein
MRQFGVVLLLISPVALALGMWTWGALEGRAEACSAICGEHWAWEGRCVCLAPLPRPIDP